MPARHLVACLWCFQALVAFKVYVNGGNKVTPAKIFTCLVLFELLRWALMNIPQIIIALVDLKVAKARYTKFLTAHEVDTSMHLADDAGDKNAALLVQNSDFSWGDAAQPALSGVNLSVQSKSLSVICGRVGSGKSSLISGLLDELRCTPSSPDDSFGYKIRGKAAYVAQEAFIQNLSVRENILFGAPFDQERYDTVVEACSLTSDFALMPSGDACEIGERGVNLSGGQKQRVAIARAVYSDAEVFLFDDPLSAVDPEVANHIFSQVIEGMLKDKTVLLVTHALNFCPRADQIIFIDGGKIAASGTYEDVMSSSAEGDASFAALINEHGIGGTAVSEAPDATKDGDDTTTNLTDVALDEKEDAKDEVADADEGKAAGKGLVEDEEVAQGEIGLEMYRYYFNEAGGWWVWFLLLFCVVAMQATMIGSEWWLGRWSLNAFDESDAYYLRWYALILSGLGFIISTRIGVIYNMGLIAAQSMHNQLLARVLSATMGFMDATPIGRYESAQPAAATLLCLLRLTRRATLLCSQDLESLQSRHFHSRYDGHEYD
jgi:ATP-binding cassette subfamily C (CFTR/MRP) protein 1